uniref:tyrosinase n=1 Tax=Ochrogaster lunifer TaxID=319761 RepID=A0AA49ESX7_OCHLU|nr:setae polypeptide [Ochrogaster lunifer]
MSSVVDSMVLLFDRPNEPIITPKGDKGAIFQLTESFVPPEYVNNGVELNNRFGDDATERIPLKELAEYPKFPNASQLPSDADFSLFLPRHQIMATEVIDTFMNVPENELQDLLSTFVYARANLNPQLFNYCYTVALMHRPDTKNVPIQNFAETFPAKFMDSKVFAKAREAAAVIPENVPRIPITIPRDYTATDLEEEHRLAYWREDIGVNLHHWHWHLVYPFTATQRSIVAKDRRGELFFYMHQQMIARYNGERLNNALRRVQKFSNWREPIPEAYYPKLDSLTSSRGWPPRQANMTWRDLKRPVDLLDITIDQMEKWRTAIEEAISTGTVIKSDGTTASLDIDTLGNMLEASILSPNIELYGSIHNNGHSFSAYMHDPEHRYLESFGVIADEATTMRDPFFYRWHAWIDDVFQRHKESRAVRPYTRSQLENPGVQVTSVAVETDGGQTNVLNTFWMMSDVDLSRGLDFSDRGPVYARFTHLNHRPFKYVIKVNNTGSARACTVRIFIAPKFDERNLAWNLSDQRKMCIEMDRFMQPLNAGENTITRLSTQSSLTIPFEQTFRDLSPQSGGDPKRTNLAEFNYCGCGWPQHMLVPKGTEAGASYQLFVMLSNIDFDRVEQPKSASGLSCVEAFSFCGLKDRLYPDKRSMGFPFDRPSSTATTLETFILPNMGLQDITIRLQNVTETNPRNPPTQ